MAKVILKNKFNKPLLSKVYIRNNKIYKGRKIATKSFYKTLKNKDNSQKEYFNGFQERYINYSYGFVRC